MLWRAGVEVERQVEVEEEEEVEDRSLFVGCSLAHNLPTSD